MTVKQYMTKSDIEYSKDIISQDDHLYYEKQRSIWSIHSFKNIFSKIIILNENISTTSMTPAPPCRRGAHCS
jgi:hypothetical protein